MRGRVVLPDLGGWLTILNATCWLLFLSYLSSQWSSSTAPPPAWTTPIFIAAFLILSLPVTPCVLVIIGSSGLNRDTSRARIILLCVLLGLNSFVWGYGLPCLWGWLSRPSEAGRSRTVGLCPSCGYDLRATPARCPECGVAVADDTSRQSGRASPPED